MKKFIISTQTLKKVLHKLSYAVSIKSTLPVLGNIWCKVTDQSIEFIACDLELTIQYRQECETTGDGFEFLMSFQLIQKIVSLSKNCPLTFSLEKKGIKITGENDVYEIKNAFKTEDFPKIPAIPVKKAMPMDGTILSWLSTALKTICNDEGRERLTKVLLELRKKEITVASTDGSFMLFSYTMPIEAPADEDILLSAKVIKALEGLEESKLYWNDKIFAFESADVTIIVTRPVDMKYVSFRAIIPQDFNSNLSVSRAALIDALEKCNINSDPFKETKLLLKNKGKVSFAAKDTQFGIAINVDVEGTYTGELESILFNSEKMLKLMLQVDFENIEIAAHDEKRPILFRAADDKGYLGLLMSMSVKNKEA